MWTGPLLKVQLTFEPWQVWRVGKGGYEIGLEWKGKGQVKGTGQQTNWLREYTVHEHASSLDLDPLHVAVKVNLLNFSVLCGWISV
jgi:hypothetical protein